MSSPRAGMMASSVINKFDWLAKYGPCIELRPTSSVHILLNPSDYYDALLQYTSTFKRRATIASLYLGTGPKELRLADALYNRAVSLASSKQKFNICMLLDAQRSSRGLPNSRTLLRPVMLQHPDKVSLFLYHTPNLRGNLKRILPERWNEIIGLQHMKYAVFDDDVILTGANLADTYFTNRQDRCMIIKNSPELADYLCDLTHHVSQFCYQARNDAPEKIEQANSSMAHPEQSEMVWFQNTFKNVLSSFTENYTYKKKKSVKEHGKTSVAAHAGGRTQIYPLLQCGLLGLNYAVDADSELLQKLPKNSSVLHLSSGYLNFTDRFAQILADNVNQTRLRFLFASPQANGFHNATGVSRFIPAMYVQLLRDYCRLVCRRNPASVESGYVRMFEWSRPDWTFHAKGAWIAFKDESSSADMSDRIAPCATLIGSSNFGWRSANRDLELQFAVVTDDADLQSELQKERDYFFDKQFACELDVRNRQLGTMTTVSTQDGSQSSSNSHEPPFWMRYLAYAIKGFF